MDNDDHTALGALADQLRHHERRSQERYEMLADKLKMKQERSMEGINSDKVNINLGGGEGGSGGAGLAAVIAALGNRNEGGDMAGLIAALGNRNNDGGMAAMLPALLAQNGNNGMNNIWPIILLALLGRGGRGGLFGGGDDCGGGGGTAVNQLTLNDLLSKLGTIEGAVPLSAANTQNVLQNAIAQLALSAQNGFANTKDAVQAVGAGQLVATAGVKDAVQNAFAILNQNILEQGCQGRAATQAGTTAILEKISNDRIRELELRADRAERSVEVNALRSQVEQNQVVNVTTSANAQQAQIQANFQDLSNRLGRLFDRVDIVHQEQRSTNANIIAGNNGAVTTGAQSSNPTNVNAR